MYWKLAFVGIVLVLLSIVAKADDLNFDQNLDDLANQVVDKAKPEIGDFTWGLISGAGDGFGTVLNLIASFSSKYLGMSVGEVMCVLVGISIIFGLFVFTKLSQNWGRRFMFIFIAFGIILVILGFLPKIFKLFKGG